MSCLKPPARSVARPPTAGPPPSLPASGPPPTPPPAAGPPPVGSAPAKASRTARARSLADTRPRLRATASPLLAGSDVLLSTLVDVHNGRRHPTQCTSAMEPKGVAQREGRCTPLSSLGPGLPVDLEWRAKSLSTLHVEHVDPVPWSVAPTR